MERIDTIVIGGGQAGLATSHRLSAHGIEHVVLERGRVGERWRSERWESLRLLTPRWLSRIGDRRPDPGRSDVDGGAEDPHGFMSVAELVRYLEVYAAEVDAPLRCGVVVTSVERHEQGYRVDTSAGAWYARRVVIATGESQDAFVPCMSRDLPGRVHQVVPTEYRNPNELPDAGVLVVGASATGVQLADEIHRSGRPVTLAVGRHTRLPRRYRGRDILWWFHDMGILDQTRHEVHDIDASRDQPSMQLTGAEHDLDLAALQAAGVRLVGRAEGTEGPRMYFGEDLLESVATADLKLGRMLMRIDEHVQRRGLSGSVEAAADFEPVPVPSAPHRLDLVAEGIRAVVWATGFRRSYPWLRVPVLTPSGQIRHDGGVTPSTGLYVIGLNFLRTRSSSFLTGVARDAEEIVEHLARSAGVGGGGRAVA